MRIVLKPAKSKRASMSNIPNTFALHLLEIGFQINNMKKKEKSTL